MILEYLFGFRVSEKTRITCTAAVCRMENYPHTLEWISRAQVSCLNILRRKAGVQTITYRYSNGYSPEFRRRIVSVIR